MFAEATQHTMLLYQGLVRRASWILTAKQRVQHVLSATQVATVKGSIYSSLCCLCCDHCIRFIWKLTDSSQSQANNVMFKFVKCYLRLSKNTGQHLFCSYDVYVKFSLCML